MFVYSEISCDEIRSLPIFRAWVSTWRYLLRRAATPTVRRSAKMPPYGSFVANRHDSASGPEGAAGTTVGGLCPLRQREETGPEFRRLHEVRELEPAVDLDRRQQRPI